MVNAANKESERGKHETNVPTAQPETKTDSWVSCPHGHTGGTRSAQTAPSQGTQAPHRDHPAQAAQPAPRIKPQGFPKALRLRRREDFLRVQAKGTRRVRGAFVVLRAERPEGPSRLGITASRKVGRAVVRNRIKRLVREFFRRHGQEIQPAADVVVIVRPQAATLKYEEVERDLAAALGLRR